MVNGELWTREKDEKGVKVSVISASFLSLLHFDFQVADSLKTFRTPQPHYLNFGGKV